jgi:hypothetical protein
MTADEAWTVSVESKRKRNKETEAKFDKYRKGMLKALPTIIETVSKRGGTSILIGANTRVEEDFPPYFTCRFFGMYRKELEKAGYIIIPHRDDLYAYTISWVKYEE